MTDTSPIVVNGNPVRDQVEAGLRLLLGAVGGILAALGYTGAAGKASALLLAVGPVAALVAFVLGQIKTRSLSKRAAAMARLLPDSAAMTK